MPAEWAPHESTWLAWPHFRGDWPGKFDPIPWVYAEIIRNLTRHESVDLIVTNAEAEKRARKVLKLANALSKNICFHRWPTNRVWTRDSGCAFVKTYVGTDAPSVQAERSSATLQAIKWRFNAWAKYPNYRHDEKIGSLMAAAAHAE
jgi:agmatine deiminase